MPETISETETRRRVPALYDSAAALEIELEELSQRNADSPLSAAQIGVFNQILADSRALLPGSAALREDVGEAVATSRSIDVHHALNTTVTPTLRNALPPGEYEQRG